MKKSLLLIFFVLFFSGCSNIRFNNFHAYSKNHKIDKNALYIKNNYLLLKKLDINSANSDKTKIVFNYLKALLYKRYNSKYFIKEENNKRNFIVLKLILKDSYWKDKCKKLTKKRCFEKLKDLKKLESYIKNPTKVNSYYYGIVIKTINQTCYTIRAGGGNCNIIHNIKDLYELYKENYKKCLLKNNYCKNNNLRQIKIIFSFKKEKKYNAVIINVVKYDYLTKRKIKEKYVVLNSKKLYILSLNKGKKFSDIFNKRLRFLSSEELLDIKSFFQ